MKTNRAIEDWTQTDQGRARYREARDRAQLLSNADGLDRGLERNDAFHYFHVFMLPRRENRCGHELRCETICCEDFERTQPGHGPVRRT